MMLVQRFRIRYSAIFMIVVLLAGTLKIEYQRRARKNRTKAVVREGSPFLFFSFLHFFLFSSASPAGATVCVCEVVDVLRAGSLTKQKPRASDLVPRGCFRSGGLAQGGWTTKGSLH